MFNFLILFNVVFILNIFLISAQVSNKRLCVNSDCTKIISSGKTSLSYGSKIKDPRLLSFKFGEDVKIYSYGAGTNPNLWGVEIRDKRGYVPSTHIRELKKNSKPSIEVDVEEIVPSNSESKEQTITPYPTKPFEVVEGTTVYDSDPTEPQENNSDYNEDDLQKSNIPTQVPSTVNSEINLDSIKIDNVETEQETLSDKKDNNPIAEQSELRNETSSTESSVLTDGSKQNKIEPSQQQSEHVGNSETLSAASTNEKEEVDSEDDDDNDDEDDDGMVEDEPDKNDKELHEEEKNEKVEVSELEIQPKDIEFKDENVIDQSQLKIGELEVPSEATTDNNLNQTLDKSENIDKSGVVNEFEKKDQNESKIHHLIEESNNSSNVESDKDQESNVTIKSDGVVNEFEKEDQNELKLHQLIEESNNNSNVESDTDQEVNVTISSNNERFENDTKVETTTVEPEITSFEGKMENSIITPKQVLHNEIEIDFNKNDLDNVNTPREHSNTGEIETKAGDIQVPLPPAFTQINNEKLTFAKNNEQLFSYDNTHTHNEHHDMQSKSEIESAKDEIFANELINEELEQELSSTELPSVEKIESHKHDFNSLLSQHIDDELSCSADPLSDCKILPQYGNDIFKLPSTAVLTVLVIAAVAVVTFLWGYMYIEKRGRESNLIGKINNIQKDYLIVKKENEILKEKLEDIESEFNEKANTVSNEKLLEIQEQLETEKSNRLSLVSQIQNLEKELENSTEVGLELNRMLSEFLNSENGSETLIANIEQLQRQIIDQQAIINTYNENLNMKETENHELRLEMDINNTKVTELQSELNNMVLNLLKLEEEKEQSQSVYESDLEKVKEELNLKKESFVKEINKLKEQLQEIKNKNVQTERDLELKSNEYLLLKESINQIKKIENNSDALKSLLDVSAVQAELLQLRKEKQLLIEQLQDENNKSSNFEVKFQRAVQDLQSFKEKYDEADKEKVEALTKLQVLDKYFKEREAQLQKELSKQESMWIEKQGEATSTIERIKYMQDELQNYKSQYESLKQEILEQEVQMKSQISVLEKKAHENWVSARQAERKLDEAKQEAAQLRNRLTLRERSFTEDKMHNRIQSPLEQNGELPISPTHVSNETTASPLIFGTRENLTISPPLPGLPFLPPPPGVPFMPPPLSGVPLPPGFMPPPPPSLISGDHRPPPLGRISSPPLNSRYSPERAYSPYSRNSPSPTSDDEYDRLPQPPMYRGYNAYSRDDRREHRPPPPIRGSIRNNKGTGHSSGSANSNDSLDKINRHNSKV